MRVQRQAEQAAFVETLVELRQAAAHVEKRLLRFGAVFRQYVNDAYLVGNQQLPRTVIQWNQRRRRSEALGQRFQPDAGSVFSSRRRFVGECEKANRSEYNLGAGKKFDFHAADFSVFFRDNKGFAPAGWKASMTLMPGIGTKNPTCRNRRITNDERNPKPQCRKFSVARSPVSSFGFENCSLFNQKAGQRTGESGRGWVGSWKVNRYLVRCFGVRFP